MAILTKYSAKVLFTQEDYLSDQIIYGTKYKEENGKTFLLNDLPDITISNALSNRGPFNWVEVVPHSIKNMGSFTRITKEELEAKKQLLEQEENKKKQKPREFITAASQPFLALQTAELRQINLNTFNKMSKEEKINALRPICLKFIEEHPDCEWKEFVEELIRTNRKEEAYLFRTMLRNKNISYDNEISDEEAIAARKIRGY